MYTQNAGKKYQSSALEASGADAKNDALVTLLTLLSGCIIVSGLALGIDGIAQRAALEAGGTVIGVIPNELPDISPQTNYKLAMNIIKNGGAILSEWKKGDGKVVNRWSFLERNRLVSGLADAVIITEAAERSGTLNTAAHALSQGRDVFAVPGNITNPLSDISILVHQQNSKMAVRQ